MGNLLGSRGLVALAVVLGLLAAVAGMVGVFLLSASQANTAPFEVGKWLLQLATVFAGTGVITAVLRQVEETRARRESWVRVLQEVVGGSDTLAMARVALAAHATAKTYREQMQKIVEVIAMLRRIRSGLDEDDAPDLRALFDKMLDYLIELGVEYRDKYLPVARQQRLDEEVLDRQIKALAEKSTPNTHPAIATALTEPLPAWNMLLDGVRFPKLKKFREDFDNSEFRSAYKQAKRLLERKAGIKRKHEAM